MADEIRPIKITDRDTGKEYILEFSRQTVVFTNNQGFKMSEFADNMIGMLPILFFGAFRMHHKEMSRAQTDDLLFNKIRKITPEVGRRLYELYLRPTEALIAVDEDDAAVNDPNASATVEL